MSRPSNSLRQPLAKARGLGSAKEGSGHFITQRVTAIALLFLLPWLIISMIKAHVQHGWEAAALWLNMPWNAVPAALFIVAAFTHMQAGMQVVIEDYIGKTWTRALLLILNTFVALAVAVIALHAILKVSSWV
ncbi:MAG: succinate dehydrogenase, hydrophobic membrane anchor protein [Caulobacterales bacterium]